MKKLMAIIMACLTAVACCFALTACGDSTNVGVQQGTTGFAYASSIKGVNVKSYENPTLAAQDLKNGKIEYIIVDGATAKSVVANVEGLKVIDIALTSEEYAIGVDKNQEELLNKINNVFVTKALEIAAIKAKYEAGLTEQYKTVTSATKNTEAPETQLVVATSASFAPFEYKSGNDYQGIDMEIAELIANELGLELVIEDMDFDSVVSSIGKNGVDVAIAALSVTASRKQSINFSKAYYVESQVIITLASNDKLDSASTVVDVLQTLCGD